MFNLIVSLVPGILYLAVFAYLLKPNISDKFFLFFLLAGVVCPQILFLIQNSMVIPPYVSKDLPDMVPPVEFLPLKAYMWETYFYASTEEITKLLAFILGYKFIRSLGIKLEKEALIFCCFCVYLGFAMVENFLYMGVFGSYVIFLRIFTSTALHVSTGIITAYFLLKFYQENATRTLIQNICLIAVPLLITSICHCVFNFYVGSTTRGVKGLSYSLLVCMMLISLRICFDLRRLIKQKN